jgi:hypothetical protein
MSSIRFTGSYTIANTGRVAEMLGDNARYTEKNHYDYGMRAALSHSKNKLAHQSPSEDFVTAASSFLSTIETIANTAVSTELIAGSGSNHRKSWLEALVKEGAIRGPISPFDREEVGQGRFSVLYKPGTSQSIGECLVLATGEDRYQKGCATIFSTQA